MSGWGNDPVVTPSAVGWGNDPLVGAKPKESAIAQAGDDFMAPIKAAGHEVADDYRNPGHKLFGPVPDLVGAAMSPIAGAMDVVRQPVLRATTPEYTPEHEAADKARIEKLPLPRVIKDAMLRAAKPKGLDIATPLSALGPEAGALGAVGKDAALTSAAVKAPMAAKEMAVGDVLHKLKDAHGLSTDELLANVKANPHRAPYHSLGDNAAGHVKVLARAPGPGRDIIRGALDTDKRGIRAKIVSDIGEGLGGKGDYLATKDNLARAQAEAAKNGMAKIGDHLVTLDENSVAGLLSDRAQTAIEEAAKNALASPDPETRNAGAALRRLHDQMLDKKTAVNIRVRDAQDISRHLLKAGTSAYAKGDGGLGKALTDLGRSVRQNAATPERGGFSEYGEWLQRYGHDAENESALELGKDAVSKTGIDQNAAFIKRELGKMGSPASKEYYRKGLAEGLLHQVQERGASALHKLLENEDFQAKVHLAHPDQASYDKFMKSAEERVAEVNRTNHVLRGAELPDTAAAKADLEGGASVGKGLQEAGGFIRGGIRNLAGKALQEVGKHLSKAEKSLIEDPETNAMLSRAYTDPREMERLLRASEEAKMRNVTPMKAIGRTVTAGTVAGALTRRRSDPLSQTVNLNQ